MLCREQRCQVCVAEGYKGEKGVNRQPAAGEGRGLSGISDGICDWLRSVAYGFEHQAYTFLKSEQEIHVMHCGAG